MQSVSGNASDHGGNSLASQSPAYHLIKLVDQGKVTYCRTTPGPLSARVFAAVAAAAALTKRRWRHVPLNLILRI